MDDLLDIPDSANLYGYELSMDDILVLTVAVAVNSYRLGTAAGDDMGDRLTEVARYGARYEEPEPEEELDFDEPETKFGALL